MTKIQELNEKITLKTHETNTYLLCGISCPRSFFLAQSRAALYELLKKGITFFVAEYHTNVDC